MRVLAVLCAVTLAGLAQEAKIPKKVDDALRARVSEFHQDQVVGNFRKALNLVATDSQDYFLSMSKEQLKIFKIEEIRYTDKFTKAEVRIGGTNRLLVGSRTVEVPASKLEYWRLQGGKWSWYRGTDADRLNFFGIPAGESSKEGSNLTKAVPTDTDKQTLASGAHAALEGASDRPLLDKSSMEFVLGTPGSQELHVRNNYKGAVHLVITPPDEQTGVIVESMEADIGPLGEVAVTVRYFALYKQPGVTKLTLQLQPFPKQYSFDVNVLPANP